MRVSTALLIIALFVSILPVAEASVAVDYRFESVRRKVLLASGETEVRAREGTEARGGDFVRTGWLGRAVLAAETRAARFEIFPASRVQLTVDTPGVLLSLERGRLKAVFDAITGNEPRIVKTPGALLAVRGTRYGVEVGADGQTTLAVFEGVVEVRSGLREEPLLVREGELCHFSRQHAPTAMPMPRGMSEHSWERRGSGGSMRGGDSMHEPSGSRGMTRGHGASGGRRH